LVTRGPNVTKVLVNASCTFIALSAAKQKKQLVPTVRDCKADEGLSQHPVRRHKTATEIKLLLNSALDQASRQKGG